MSTLDPVQIAALDFARDKRGVGWFLEQGLGKTLCALAEFSWYEQLDEADRLIVVCPNTFKQGWVDEAEKHGFKFNIHVFRSSKKIAAAVFLGSKFYDRPPALIINYEALRMPEVLKAVAAWAGQGKTYFAIDESIQIKGNRTAQTRAVHKLAPLCAFVRILTGRPQTQGPHDLWGQLRAIGLFPYTNFYVFRGEYCVMGGWQNKEVLRAKNETQLASYMAPAVFQAKKRDWLPELPRKDSTIRDYAMSTEQLAQYLSMEQQFLLYLENNVVTVDVAIAKYEKLAQIQTGFIYDEQGAVHALVDPRSNPRLNLLLQLLEEEVAGKACVVYRHRPVLDMLTRALDAYSPAWIKGGMKPEEVENQKWRFNADPLCRVILLQAEASKYGHTLLGGPGPDDLCRTMIFFENSYSADTRDQIEDRIHRRGQTGESVLYIDLSGSDLDRRIVKALQRKDALYRSVFKNLRAAVPVGAKMQEEKRA
jgi:SNF2 family DNA or RNA helicase